jgi:serine/threonine protein kinase
MHPTKIHNYECMYKIGNGKFGLVFKGKHEKTGKYVAIKTECQSGLSILKYETTMLNYLYGKKVPNIPHIYWFGLYENVQYLVMSFYDCSLYDFVDKSGSLLDNNENIVSSLLRVLYSVHEVGVVHRDIKPHNFMLKNNTFFLIDFGMATFYVDKNTNHIPETNEIKQHLMGTLKYISYNVHSGKSYTRRDDVISIAYIYMWLNGLLFWNTSDIISNTYRLNSDEHRSIEFHRTPSSSRPAYFTTPETMEQLPETHIFHPTNKYIHRQKEIDYIKEYLYKTGVNHLELISFLEYAYQIGFYETPKYFQHFT